MDSHIIDLYNEYVHKALPRRTFIARLARLTGSVAAASAVLPLLERNYARARQVEEKDPCVSVGYVTYRGLTADVRAYQARPKQGRKVPENRG